MSKKPKHILVIRLSAMGDVAMTVPVLRAFSAQYPEVKLTVLTKSFFKPFFRDLPNIQVFEAEINNNHKGFFGLWKLSRELKKLQFDAVADLHNVLRSNILKLFFFGKQIVQINKGREEKKALVIGSSFEQLKTTHERYADVFDQLGYKIDLDNPTFPKKKNLSETYLKLIGSDSKQWIGIAPFAAFKGKMYPIESMKEVIGQLSKNHKVILFGAGNNEAQQLERIAYNFKNVSNCAGQFSLSEELDIISNLDLMLAMDSGNAHLAAMLGVKVITVWGVTHPYAGFLPFNHTIESTLLADRHKFPKIPTSIYGNNLPDGYEEVMYSITPDQILNKIRDYLMK